MPDATVEINYPAGFGKHGGVVVFKHMGISVSFALWMPDPEGWPPMFRITQCWEDGEETTQYFYLHELEAMAKAAREHMDSQAGGG